MSETVLAFENDDNDIPGYEMIERIGMGAFSTIYRARQLSLNRDVAIRCIRSDLTDLNGGGVAQNEAEILSRLAHPNVVTLLERIDHRGDVCLVLEYAGGGSMESIITQRTSPRLAAALVARIARTLAYVHDCGITHCNLKPRNILFAAPPIAGDPHTDSLDYESAYGIPLISSFGLAIDGQGGADQQDGQIRGTISYMSPEQARGSWKEIGPASDIYAMGGILYTLLAGCHPFAGQDFSSLLSLKMHEDPQPVRQWNPATDAELAEICHRCLQRQPESRYPDALTLARELGGYLRNPGPSE